MKWSSTSRRPRRRQSPRQPSLRVANLLNGLSISLLGTALTNVLTQLLNNILAALAGL